VSCELLTIAVLYVEVEGGKFRIFTENMYDMIMCIRSG